MRVMGIDPGSSATGYGVVERDGAALRYVTHGTLRPARGAPLPERLASLLSGLSDVMDAHGPDAVVVEKVFVAASPRSALVLGQARGVALATAAARALPVVEYSPSQIKSAVVGTGSAEKVQVQAMVKSLLGLGRAPARDAADALAAAICHVHTGRLGSVFAGELGGLSGRGRGRSRRASRGFVLRRG